jgi:hypothetical protein
MFHYRKDCDCSGTSSFPRLVVTSEIEQRGGVGWFDEPKHFLVTHVSWEAGPVCDVCDTPWKPVEDSRPIGT